MLNYFSNLPQYVQHIDLSYLVQELWPIEHEMCPHVTAYGFNKY